MGCMEPFYYIVVILWLFLVLHFKTSPQRLHLFWRMQQHAVTNLTRLSISMGGEALLTDFMFLGEVFL